MNDDMNDGKKPLLDNDLDDVTVSDAISDLDLTPIDQELELELLKKNEESEQQDEELTFSLNTRRDERHLALYLLYALDRSEYTIDLGDIVHAFEQGFDITIPSNSFTLMLVRNVLENRDELDEYLTPFLKNWRLERLGCCTRLILRLALWELRQPDAISSISINEAIELAKMFAEKDAYRFVNGILDEIAKQLPGGDKERIENKKSSSEQKDEEEG